MPTLSPTDPRLTWAGAVALEHTPSHTTPWRLPLTARALVHPELAAKAAQPAGVRLAFSSDTRLVAGRIAPHPEPRRLDLCIAGELTESIDLTDRASFRFADLPAGEKHLELWLPQFGPFWLEALDLSAGATLTPVADTRPRWLTYGSSITHCKDAASPARTWPALVARRCGFNLTCLGFGGQCHLDVMVARAMRDLSAEFISLCVGINIHGSSSLGPRALQPGLVGFIEVIREKHPETPIVVVSPISSPAREETPNAVGLTLERIRHEVAEGVRVRQQAGDNHVHYQSGLELFGPELAHLLPDGLHPNAEGYEQIAEAFINRVARTHFTNAP